MPRLSQEETLKKYPVGSVVRVDPTQLSRFITEAATKMKDRLGEVTFYNKDTNQLLVVFPAIGRRLRYQARMYADETLELVTDAAQIAAWRQEVAHKAKQQEAYARKQQNQRKELAHA